LPNVRTVHSIGSRYQLWAIRSGLVREVDAVAIHQRLVDPTVMSDLRGVASAVYVWGVVDGDRALALIDSGASGIIVDGVALLGEIRSRLDVSSPSAAPTSQRRDRTITTGRRSGAVLADMSHNP
jgi:hypothetical protein